MDIKSMIPDESKIYDQRTMRQFKSVSSSYSIGNYRSAVTELYSVTVADVMYK